MSVTLEIHHIGIQGGDVTAIKIYDPSAKRTVRILIDAGGEHGEVTFKPVLGYISKFFGAEPFDYAIASHYHADHISGFSKCGIAFKQQIDIGGYKLGNAMYAPINPIDTLTTKNTIWQRYTDFMDRRWQATKPKDQPSFRVPIPFVDAANYKKGVLSPRSAGPLQLNLVPGKVTLTCYCAGGVLANGTNALRANVEERVLRKLGWKEAKTKKEQQRLTELVDETIKKVSPNDHSLAFILDYKDGGKTFRYYTSGDLSGDLSLTRYCNIEEPLMNYLSDLKVLDQPITVMKATHHGSNHNNYPRVITRVANYSLEAKEEEDDEGVEKGAMKEFKSKNGKGLLAELRPETIVIPCNQMKGVPGGEYLTRLLEYSQAVGTAAKPISIAFVNECIYPRPSGSFDTKQKAQKKHLQAIFDAQAKHTNLTVSTATINNGSPTAVVVRVPAVSASWRLAPADTDDTIMWRSFQVTRKATHSLIVHATDIDVGDVTLEKDSVAKMPVLTTDMYDTLEKGISERVNEVFELEKTGKIKFVAESFPSLVDTSKKKPILLFPDPGQLISECIKLLTSSFLPTANSGPKDIGRLYNPAKQIARNDRITVRNFLKITPEHKRANRGLLGDLMPEEIQTVRKKRKGDKLDEQPKKKRRVEKTKSS